MKASFIKTHVAVEWKGDTRNHFSTVDGKIPNLSITYIESRDHFKVTDGIAKITVPLANVPYYVEIEEADAKKKVNER